MPAALGAGFGGVPRVIFAVKLGGPRDGCLVLQRMSYEAPRLRDNSQPNIA